MVQITNSGDTSRPKVITFGGNPLVKWYAYRKQFDGKNLYLQREVDGVRDPEVKIIEPDTVGGEADHPGIVVSDFVVNPVNDVGVYQQEVTVENAGALASGHQVKVTLDTATLVATGKMNSNRKVKFLDTLDNELDYWAEDEISGFTTYFVKFDVAAGTNTIKVEYTTGADYSASEASGDTVFETFDDFEDGAIDGAKWAVTGATAPVFAESGGELTGGNTSNYIRSVATFNNPVIVTALVNESSPAANGFTTIGFFNGTSDDLNILSHNGTSYYHSNGSFVNFAYNGIGGLTRDEVWMTGSQGRITRNGVGGSYDSGFFPNTLNGETLYLGQRGDQNPTYNNQTYGAQWRFIHVRKYNADVGDGVLGIETQTGTLPVDPSAFIYFISDGVLYRAKVSSDPIGEEPTVQTFDRTGTRREFVKNNFVAVGMFRDMNQRIETTSLPVPSLALGGVNSDGLTRPLVIAGSPNVSQNTPDAMEVYEQVGASSFNLIAVLPYEPSVVYDVGIAKYPATKSYRARYIQLTPSRVGAYSSKITDFPRLRADVAPNNFTAIGMFRDVIADANDLQAPQLALGDVEEYPVRLDGLELYYSFNDEDTEGTTLKDRRGGGLDATLVGSPTTGIEGLRKEAYFFNGTSQYLNIGNVSALDFTTSTPFSIAFSYLLPTAPSGHKIAVSKYNAGVSGGWEVVFSGGALSFSLVNSAYTGRFVSMASTPYGNTFQKVVVTYDGSNTAAGIRFFANGEEVDVNINQDNNPGSISNTAAALVGARVNGGTPLDFLSFTVDEMSIFSRELTPAEAKAFSAKGYLAEERKLLISFPENNTQHAENAQRPDGIELYRQIGNGKLELFQEIGWERNKSVYVPARVKPQPHGWKARSFKKNSDTGEIFQRSPFGNRVVDFERLRVDTAPNNFTGGGTFLAPRISRSESPGGSLINLWPR